MKIKILNEGQPCRRCNKPVVKQTHKPGFVPNPKKTYYFEYWFKCMNCNQLYMVEEARRVIKKDKLKTLF